MEHLDPFEFELRPRPRTLDITLRNAVRLECNLLALVKLHENHEMW